MAKVNQFKFHEFYSNNKISDYTAMFCFSPGSCFRMRVELFQACLVLLMFIALEAKPLQRLSKQSEVVRTPPIVQLFHRLRVREGLGLRSRVNASPTRSIMRDSARVKRGVSLSKFNF